MCDTLRFSEFQAHAEGCAQCVEGRFLCPLGWRLLGQATGMWQQDGQLELFASGTPAAPRPEAWRTARERSVC